MTKNLPETKWERGSCYFKGRKEGAVGFDNQMLELLNNRSENKRQKMRNPIRGKCDRRSFFNVR